MAATHKLVAGQDTERAQLSGASACSATGILGVEKDILKDLYIDSD